MTGEQEMKSSIIVDNKKVPVEWDNVVTFEDSPEWALPDDNMKKRSTVRRVRSVVVHWMVV